MATYTHGHHESVLRSHTWRTVDNSAAYLVPHLRAGLDVLDVGCGPGTITDDLAARVAPGRVIGVDAVAGVMTGARNRAAADVCALPFDDGTFDVVHAHQVLQHVADPVAALREMARVCRAGTGVIAARDSDYDAFTWHPADPLLDRWLDVYALPVDDGTFDVVHAHQLLQHVADPVSALREMARVCRDGTGIVAARDSDYDAFTWYPADPLLHRWLDVYRTVARQNGGEPDAGRHLLAWAHAAGLTDVRPSASVWCFATPDDRAWWGGLWADRVTSSSLGDQALERGLATRDDLDAMAAAWRSWSVDDDGWFAVVHGEILARP
jgi:ubiquinone/menaquinone biosynthesis C-methylase UbiE